MKARLLGLLAGLVCFAAPAAAIDVVAMYRGSCQVDTGVILRVDAKSVTYLAMNGVVTRIPRYDIVGMASYPLPGLPIKDVTVPAGMDVPVYAFETYRDGHVAPLAAGWPIEYNAEHVQVLTLAGRDHLVERGDIWGVTMKTAPRRLTFSGTTLKGPRYKLRHPLAFETCPDNVTPGVGEPIPIIPQTTLDNPILIKKYQDHLREGRTKVEDYAERERFYAVPQYYVNATRLGTWALLGSRYANVGARQANFLPLVEDETSEGPFGFQRIVRSGVAPLAWGLHEEPVVQVFYGLKADYVHLQIFFDPTAPLIGGQYKYAKGQLDPVDDRLVETGGLEFGFDLGGFSVYVAYSEGDMAIRAHDYFMGNGFGLARYGASFQLNRAKLGFYYGQNGVDLDTDLKETFRFLKVFAEAPLGRSLRLRPQLIQRTLADASGPAAPIHYDATSQTVAAEVDYDLDYRWTLYALPSAERQTATARAGTASGDVAGSVSVVHPKLAGGVTIKF